MATLLVGGRASLYSPDLRTRSVQEPESAKSSHDSTDLLSAVLPEGQILSRNLTQLPVIGKPLKKPIRSKGKKLQTRKTTGISPILTL